MKHSERFALNEWLSDYPAHMSYDEILDLLYANEDQTAHELISVWQWLDSLPLRVIMENIDNTKCHFERVVDDLLWGVALANLTEEETRKEQERRA